MGLLPAFAALHVQNETHPITRVFYIDPYWLNN